MHFLVRAGWPTDQFEPVLSDSQPGIRIPSFKPLNKLTILDQSARAWPGFMSLPAASSD
jgi:hypothetical protein